MNPSETSQKTNLLNSIDGSEAASSSSSPLDLNALSSTVSFTGWRLANINFLPWVTKMAYWHEPTWRKAGIYEAVMAYIVRISKQTDLILCLANKWCPKTNTFVFPWGEVTITLEDVMVLLGFSVLGGPVYAGLDSEGERIKAKLVSECSKIVKDNKVTSLQAWTKRFMNSGDSELEHVAFLVAWLSYFVFPSHSLHVYEVMLPIAIHLSRGTRIALAPAVLAHLYADLSILKTHIRGFTISKVIERIELSGLFMLVQVWTWERFRRLQPLRNELVNGEPRLALWHNMMPPRKCDVREVLDNSKKESFEWRPYTKPVKKWEFPQFYPEKAMLVPVGPNLNEEFVSFARCITVSELVGIYCVEHYFPDRVASQFGMIRDVPGPVERNKLSREEAWNTYSKPMDDLTLYIPSRSATANLVDETLKPRNIIGDDTTSSVPLSSKINRTSKDGVKITDKSLKYMKSVPERNENSFVHSSSKMNGTSEERRKLAEDLEKKRHELMKLARDKRREYLKLSRDKRQECMKRGRENDESTMAQCQKEVAIDSDDKDNSAHVKRSGEDSFEPLVKRSRLVADITDFDYPSQKLDSIRVDGNNSLDPSLGFDEAINIVESPNRNGETRKTSGQLEDLEHSNESYRKSLLKLKDSFEESSHELKRLDTRIDELTIEAERNLEWLKEQRAIRDRNLLVASPLI